MIFFPFAFTSEVDQPEMSEDIRKIKSMDQSMDTQQLSGGRNQ